MNIVAASGQGRDPNGPGLEVDVASILSPRGKLSSALWGLIVFLFVALMVVASWLLVRSGLFTSDSVSDEQAKALWAFLGVLLGAVATLIGAMLTYQSGQRAEILKFDAQQRADAASREESRLRVEAEDRLQVDTVIKTLDLLPSGEVGSRVRSAGVLAALVQLDTGPVALRVLGDLWKENIIDAETATWCLDQVVARASTSTAESDQSRTRLSKDEAIETAAFIVFGNTQRLWAKDYEEIGNSWPKCLSEDWDDIPDSAKPVAVFCAVSVLAEKDLGYWQNRGGYPEMICRLLRSSEWENPHASICALAALSIIYSSNASSLFLALPNSLGMDDRLRFFEEKMGNNVEYREQVNPFYRSILEKLAAQLATPN